LPILDDLDAINHRLLGGGFVDITFQPIAPDNHFTARNRRRITLQYIKPCLLVRTPESDIENLLADAQISYGQTAQPGWQHGIDVKHL
jgi:hypothetical protein